MKHRTSSHELEGWGVYICMEMLFDCRLASVYCFGLAASYLCREGSGVLGVWCSDLRTRMVILTCDCGYNEQKQIRFKSIKGLKFPN